MKKNGILLRIGVAAMVLTLASTSLMSGTLAKYFSESTGTAAAIIAKWSPQAKIGEQLAQNWAVNLADTQEGVTSDASNTKVASGCLAPGMKGAFPVEVSANKSEVAIDYKVEVSVSDVKNGLIQNIKFKVYDNPVYSEGGGKEVPLSGQAQELFSGTLSTTGSEIVKKYVYWEWPYETAGDTSANNSADTNAGKIAASASSEADRTQNINITITMTQADGTVG